MGYMDEYYKALESMKNSPSSTGGKSSGGVIAPLRLAAPMKKREKPMFRFGDIAPVLTQEKKRTWFQKGTFEDGYQFGDVSKAILGTLGDTAENFGAGILGMGESLLDTSVLLGPAMEEARRAQSGDPTHVFDAERYAQDQERAKQFIQQDLYDEEQVAKAIISAPMKKVFEVDTEKDSVFGEKIDTQAQSAGRWVAQRALQTVGMPWWMSTAATSLGSETESAFREGASFEEGGGSAAINTAGEIIIEMLSGGMFGETGLDDLIVKDFSRIVPNKVASNLLKIGLKAGGEGFEEALSWAVGNVGKKLTYADEKTWKELFTSERAVDELIESVIGGTLLGGIGSTYEASKMKKAGIDYASGLTGNEQKVVDAEYKRRVAEAEKDGKIKDSRKAKIYDQVIHDMDKGAISAERIEEILGGQTYKAYKDAMDSKDDSDFLNEYDQLGSKEGATPRDNARYAEMTPRVKEITERRRSLKQQLRGEVSGKVVGDRLIESYNEMGRRGQKFEADLSKYDEKQRAVVQKAIDSGVMNNTNRSHEFVDLVAKISADKGISFDFANNQKIRESGYAVEGKTVNGYVTKDGITINVDSPKYMESIAGHEITHVLEGTELYSELQKAVFDYATSNGELQSRWREIKGIYKDADNAQVNQELTADLVGEYLFTDPDFVSSLHSGSRNIFEKIYDEIKYLCKVVTAGSKEARQLEKVKKTFADAYRTESNAQKNTASNSGVQYSVSETTDGRTVAVVDNDILSHIDTSKWDATTKAEAKKAAVDALKTFKDGIVVDGITRKVNRTSWREYTRSKYTAGLYKYKPDVFADKMRAAEVADDIVVATTDWKRDGGLKHPRTDEFVDFDHGTTLIQSGNTKYSAEVVVGITDTGEAVFYDVVDMQPSTFEIKKEESPPTATTHDAIGDIKGNSSSIILPQDVDIVNDESNLTEPISDGDTSTQQEVFFSLSNDSVYMDRAIAQNTSSMAIDPEVMQEAKAIREKVAGLMNAIKDNGLVALPDDIEGNTYIANSSSDGTEENTTICPRSLASEAFTDAVAEYLGRPLTVQEQIYISQDLQGRTLTPECVYCYVATDRKPYRAFLGEYVNQRDAVLDKLKANPNADVSRSGALYQEFLNGRKDTNPMYSRFKMWVDSHKGGKPMIDASHLANINKLMGDINSEFGTELKPQIVDAMKYAQSASWAKKRVNYVAYNGHILNWKQDRITKLNSHYGLRMYSFSDFHPAFVLENMQMVTDASVRGLKMLGYTKDTDFVEIFAPSGMNINISTFGFESGGNVFENNLIGAEWQKAKELREQYPNVGITFVATNDTLVNWAMDQEWIDVVIPYHLVRTGKEVAKAFKYTDYTGESSDKKDAGWQKGADKKYIAPTEHNNDKATYLDALAKNHLKPRFERFIDNPNYMKLVNECRQPASESKPVQPKFGEEAAMSALAKLAANGYYQPIGGSVDRMYEIAAEVAENMTNDIAPVKHSLSDSDIAPVLRGRGTLGKEIAYDPTLSEKFKSTATFEHQEKEWSAVRSSSASSEEAVENALKEKTGIKRFWAKTVAAVFDRGAVFEKLSLDTGNRRLMGMWNHTLSSGSRAQYMIGEGDKEKGIRSLDSMREQAVKSGKVEAFHNYMYHWLNVDRMTLSKRYPGLDDKPVFGYAFTAEMSQKEIAKYERENPEFVSWAKEIYKYTDNQLDMMVDSGFITQETADDWRARYPHYIPIHRDIETGGITSAKSKSLGIEAPIRTATGGNQKILPLFDTLAKHTLQTYNAVAKNNFSKELMKTLGTSMAQNSADTDTFVDFFDTQEELLRAAMEKGTPTFEAFQDGVVYRYGITKEMHEALSPVDEKFKTTIKPLNVISNVRRGLITQYNPVFTLTNAIKDAQDVLLNSQHAAKTYIKMPEAYAQILGKGYWYNEYMKNGGNQNGYFNQQDGSFDTDKKGVSKILSSGPLKWISAINEVIETAPRLAEYIASREAGRSVEVSILDAARVTTNFAAGGYLTKMIDRNGATFLNSSVQGAMQQVRNVREAYHNGFTGVMSLVTKTALAGLPAVILNGLVWDDDEDYQELADYVKESYYCVWKTENGKFIRIPKGRMMATIQSAVDQVMKYASGDDDADYKTFLRILSDNVAPNNPFTDNIFAPIVQVATNKTWYGEDLVPSRLQGLPAEEQYDEKTASISRIVGEKFGVSPYKVNYLLDQYSGAVGDVLMPMMTPKAESGDDSFLGNLIAPLKDKFTTDYEMNKQVVSDFFDTEEALEVKVNSPDATEKDMFVYRYMQTAGYEVAALYAEKREIQISNLSNSEKYKKAREIQMEINDIMEHAMNVYNDGKIKYKVSGNYAEVGDRRYNYSAEKDRWYEISAKDDPYGYYKKEQEVTKGLGISPEEYWNNRKEYNFKYDHPDLHTLSEAVGGYDYYSSYVYDMWDVDADKDKNGNDIRGSYYKNLKEFVGDLDLTDVEKDILIQSQYRYHKFDRNRVIDYLNDRDDISYSEMKSILETLGMKVDDKGYITW